MGRWCTLSPECQRRACTKLVQAILLGEVPRMIQSTSQERHRGWSTMSLSRCKVRAEEECHKAWQPDKPSKLRVFPQHPVRWQGSSVPTPPFHTCSGSSFAVVFILFSFQNDRPFPVRETLVLVCDRVFNADLFFQNFIASPLHICNCSGSSLAVTSLLETPFSHVTWLWGPSSLVLCSRVIQC